MTKNVLSCRNSRHLDFLYAFSSSRALVCFGTHVDYFFDEQYRDIFNKHQLNKENGRRRRPVCDYPDIFPSRLYLTVTRLDRIYDGRTRNTDGAQP
jgi:hypothetical protein